MRPSLKDGLLVLLPLTAVTGVNLGCDEGANLNRTPPFLAASAVEIDFGEREVGTTEERTIFLLNKGELQLSLELPDGDSLNGVFAVLLDEQFVPPEEEAKLRVRFSPFDPQTYETVFMIENNSSNEELLEITVKGIGIPRDPCADMDCRAPPAPVCISANTSRRYEPLGLCMNGRCEHNFMDEPCNRGCNDETGVCRGDPCAGIACNTPPSPCFLATGMCKDGACEYMVNNAGVCDDNKACTTGDRCEEGTCVGDQRVCDTPPEALCVDAMTRRFWNAQGTCNMANGACDYMQQDQQCPFGCEDGACLGNPCAGIVCDTPPAAQCYEQTGTCVNGACQYATVAGACNDNDACTLGDTCNNGTCGGTPMVCNSPPAAACVNGTTLQTYAMNGTCNAGTCEYAPTTVVCDDSDACTVNDFCNAGACRSGAMNSCADSNACTANLCDPVAGCSNPPISGGACTTNSSECPTGSCSAGSCLPTAGVTCLATYDICFGLSEQEVAGVCSASGDCVVSQAPPQFTCPGCNGLCVVCPLVGTLCIPFN